MGEQRSGDIAAVIRGKLLAKRLPRDPPRMIWGGYGRGLACDACDAPIAPAEIEYEPDVPGWRGLRFHQLCLAMWLEERARAGHVDAERPPCL